MSSRGHSFATMPMLFCKSMVTKTSTRVTHETCDLRRHTLQDIDQVFRLASDPAVLQSIGGAPPSREDAWHRLLRYAGHWSLLGFGMFAVFERATNQFIGEVGLADFQRDLGDHFDGVPEAAWVFTGRSHGKGFALEAMTAALDWFDRQAVSSRSVCMIEPRNTASTRLAEKLGFTYYARGCYRSHDVYQYERMRPDHQPPERPSACKAAPVVADESGLAT